MTLTKESRDLYITYKKKPSKSTYRLFIESIVKCNKLNDIAKVFRAILAIN
jgi:hypothetical protein